MEIQIIKIDDSTEDIVVNFTTPYGEGRAFWNGTKKYKPELNEKYKVEYDISDILEWGKEITLSKKNDFSIETTEDGIILTGKLEGIDRDGIAELRFGESIIQLEIEGGKLPTGKFVDINTNEIEIYEKAY